MVCCDFRQLGFDGCPLVSQDMGVLGTTCTQRRSGDVGGEDGLSGICSAPSRERECQHLLAPGSWDIDRASRGLCSSTRTPESGFNL